MEFTLILISMREKDYVQLAWHHGLTVLNSRALLGACANLIQFTESV